MQELNVLKSHKNLRSRLVISFIFRPLEQIMLHVVEVKSEGRISDAFRIFSEVCMSHSFSIIRFKEP